MERTTKIQCFFSSKIHFCKGRKIEKISISLGINSSQYFKSIQSKCVQMYNIQNNVAYQKKPQFQIENVQGLVTTTTFVLTAEIDKYP